MIFLKNDVIFVGNNIKRLIVKINEINIVVFIIILLVFFFNFLLSYFLNFEGFLILFFKNEVE